MTRSLAGMLAVMLCPLADASADGAFQATQFHLLVGTYTRSGSEGIYLYRFDSRLGRLDGPLGVARTPNPSFFSFTANQRVLFVLNENGRTPRGDAGGRVTSFRFDAASGALHEIDQQETQGDEPTYSSLSPDGRYLFVANYSTLPQGSLAVLRVGQSGTLGAVVQTESHAGSGVDPDRQSCGHTHSVAMAPHSDFLFAADLGADKVFAYRYQPERSDRPLQPAQPPFFAAPAGSGPRHILFSADGRFAYLTLELSGAVMALQRNGARLVPLQTLPLAPPGFQGKVGAGALHLSADGRFLYVLNRGDDNHLAIFAVDPGDGRLTLLKRRSVEGESPRDFTIAPGGRFLLVANQASNSIELFARDPLTGLVTDKLQSVPLDSPAFLQLLPRGR